jgi:uncharacterized protein YhaN
MRFERLDLSPYGRFADLRLVFSPEAALHVVLGRNEAGKTTTLEAIKDFLFGVETRTAYAFEHGYDALRIGAALRFAGGARFEARRRKGRSNTLVDEANKPVSDEPLLHALGSVDRKIFETEFGLSQEKLREGGDALLQAGGALSETLAAGSAGLGALVKLRDRLEEEAGKLFTPRKSEGKEFYVALDAFTTADRTLRDAVVRADELKRADQKHIDALDAEQRLREEQEEIGRQLALRERANRTHPTLARLEAVAHGLQTFADLPRIDAGALANARGALDQDRALQATLAELAAEAEAEAQETLARVVDQALLDDGGAIEACREKLSEVRKAADDLPRRVEARTQAIHQLDDLARRLGLDGCEALLAAPPSDAEIAEARHAIESQREAARRRDEARARAGEAARRCEDLDRAAAPGPVVDPEPLRRRLDALAERVADAERLRRESAALDRLRRELDEFAARLMPPVADPEALARAPLPAAAEVEAFARADQARAQAGEIAAREAGKAQRSLEAAEAALKAREREAAGATRADWLAAREARERALDRLGEALDAPVPEARRESFDQARALTLAADGIGDRYVEDVERATRLEAAREDRAARREDLARAQAEVRRLAEARDAAQGEWRAMWARSGFAPLAPAAMVRWLDQAEALLKRRAELAGRAAEVEVLRARIAEAEASLAQAFAASAGFETAYREARAELAARQAAFEAATKAAQARAQAAEAARIAKAELDARAAELDALAAGWAPAMRALRLPETATAPAAEAALAGWAAVSAPRALMERETRSVEGIERDLAEFARDVHALAQRLAPELAAAKPEVAVARLVERLAEARRIAAERTQLEKSAQNRAARRRAEEGKRQALAPILAAARALLGAADDDRLALALERCEARRQLEAEQAQALQQLVQAGDGRGEAELRAEQQGLDVSLLAYEIAALKGRREELDAARREAARAVRDAEAEYETLSLGRDAAEAARRRAEAAGNILDVSERWLLRSAAAKLAARAIERHRAAAQDPLIARAGALFALATAGGFSGLAIDYDAADRPILVARRPSGQSVKVEGLSEGARDQLFLSLRLALLERRAGEPLPFIGDDLLASFDDERARHTLGLLAEFGAKRQTILFTHHARVAEIAAGLPGGRVEVIEM